MHDGKYKKKEERVKKWEYKAAKIRYFLFVYKKRILLISFLISLIIFITSVIFLNEIGLLIVIIYPFLLIMLYDQFKGPSTDFYHIISFFFLFILITIIGFFI